MSAVELLLHAWDVGFLEVVLWERVKATEDYGLIHGEPMEDFGVISFEDNASVVCEVIDNVCAQPSTVGVLQEERKIPVVQRSLWYNTILKTGVNHIVIVS